MTNSLICLVEDENKNCVKWCYPPRYAKKLTLQYSAAPWPGYAEHWAAAFPYGHPIASVGDGHCGHAGHGPMSTG